MTFVKTPGPDPVAIDKLGEAAASAAGKQVEKATGVPEKAAVVVEAMGEGGIKGAGAHVATTVVAEAIRALSQKVPGKLSGIMPGLEMPTFEDRAVTSFTGGAAAGLDQGLLGKISGKAAALLGGKNLELEVGSGDALDVRTFAVEERIASLFRVELVAVSESSCVDFDSVVGQPARFTMHAGAHDRTWSGLCKDFEQTRVEPGGLSTYKLTIVPTLWLLTQRKNYRIFQQISEPDIVLDVLREWDIDPVLRIDRGSYKKRKYRVQYAESDFAFVSRVLEDAGITYFFEQDGDETRLVLSDAPHEADRRSALLEFVDDTTTLSRTDIEFVTAVRVSQRVRPGKYTMRDHDYRRPPDYELLSSAAGGHATEERLERYQYTPGAFLFGTDQGDATPHADDRGKTRTDEKEAARLAQKRLDAKRNAARQCTFETNAHDLGPGVVVGIGGHPHPALDERKNLLVVQSSLRGTSAGEWVQACEARGTDVPFRPALSTTKPTVNGVESATVVGPAGEEIHTDEFGRVRVHFHWDRESKMDERSSTWLHVSQPWAGSGYGMINLPRIGQEVLVTFLAGDPDRPVIAGRVYTNLQKVPYKLPDNKTQSGWRSHSTGGGGGYNELMFEDAQGREVVNIQAQKDLTKLVKNDETETTGVNRTISVGANRSASVGQNDSAMVGVQHSITIAAPAGSDATSVTMSHDSIVLTTSGATIALGKDTIELSAREITLSATEKVIIDGEDAVLINCTDKPPPDEVQMPSLEDEVVDELINLIPGGKVVELGAKLIFGEAPVDGVKSGAAGALRQGADAVRGVLGTGGTSGHDAGTSGGGGGW